MYSFHPFCFHRCLYRNTVLMENKQEQFERADLILKYLKGELNPQEEQEMELWVEESEKNRLFFDRIRNEQALEEELAFFSRIDTDKAWQRIAAQTVDQQKTRSLWSVNTVWKYAAAITLILGTVFLIYQTQQGKHTAPATIAEVTPKLQPEDILPGGDKAKLTFSDGSVFLLEDMENGTVRQEQGVKVSKLDGVVTFEIADSKSDQVFYNTISTPVGGQYQVVLPDGSKVWLNSASSLYFPSAFVGNERTVELTGEAYFEVARNQKQVFQVKVDEATIEVLGTHFNVMAYANEGRTTATLVEGSVRVKKGNVSKMMTPGQQATIGEDIKLKKVDVDEAIAWKNGLFYFSSADIATVMRQMERWYGIEVAYSGNMSAKHFSGIISRNTEISKMLEMLELTGSIQFRREGRKVVVSTI